jgi:hypothetical protein
LAGGKEYRRKEIFKQKAEERGTNHRLQKFHISYREILSEISNEVWKKKWKDKILFRHKYLHPTEEKEAETSYKEIIDLHPKDDSKQFEEVINQDDTPIEFMDHSAALRETLIIDLHCTGSKGGYESAGFIQLSGKNLDYHSKSGFDDGELIVNFIKDNNSTFIYHSTNRWRKTFLIQKQILMAAPQLNTRTVRQLYGKL